MRYRDLATHADLRRVVELEKLVWGYTDAEDVVPLPILAITIKRGGILVGAFDEADRMVGFVYSLPALHQGRSSQWSHMLGVLDECRGAGVGYRLKLEQRRRTIEGGQDLVEWTFDPLQGLNAHLNFRKLGAVAEEYAENVYGESSSPLHRGTPTDRLIAQWWVQTPRVDRALSLRAVNAERSPAPLAPDPRPVVNRTSIASGVLRCETVDTARSEPVLLAEIPLAFTEIQRRDPGLALAWRHATREIFATYFRAGYRAVDFVLDRSAGRGRYVLASGQNHG